MSVCLCLNEASGQNFFDATFGKSISLMARDSSFLIKPGFRFQTLYDGELDLETDNWEESLMIRRCRLKFDGYAYSPSVIYKLELGLSNRDTQAGRIDEAGNTASIILDAVIKWNFAPSWSLWFGQTKLPGNRERLISSQKLQFVDRSPVNSSFNLDRDIGIQLHHVSRSGSQFIWKQSFALSSGEGRDIVKANEVGGRQYTFKLEFLPMGDFHLKGEYFGSDLFREPEPKLALAVTADYNRKALRSRGNLGSFITNAEGNYVSSSLYTLFLDGLFKYRGMSAAFEYAYRDSDDIEEGFGYGQGITVSSGYLFRNGYEIAGRYSAIDPIIASSSLAQQNEYLIGFSKYVVGHNLKIQTDASYNTRGDDYRFLQFRLQTELAF